MKIISYNVNGIRAAINKGFLAWLIATDADIICLQEIKANPDQIADLHMIEQLGYSHYWYPAQKKGYSGTAILSKLKPLNVHYGCGINEFDYEGRIIRADFKNFSVISAYFPSGSSGEERQVFKYHFLEKFADYIEKLKIQIPNLIISGDYNICHQAIDIHNPKSNANSSGFLPEERAWLDIFLKKGFIDTFRYLNPNPHHYTWWSYRAGARSKNLGWRIDYHMVANNLAHVIKRAAILPDAKHSDHCPILLELAVES